MKCESEVSQLCPTLGDPMDCSLPGSSIPGIFQARVLEWGAIAFSEVIKIFPHYIHLPSQIYNLIAFIPSTFIENHFQYYYTFFFNNQK